MPKSSSSYCCYVRAGAFALCVQAGDEKTGADFRSAYSQLRRMYIEWMREKPAHCTQQCKRRA